MKTAAIFFSPTFSTQSFLIFAPFFTGHLQKHCFGRNIHQRLPIETAFRRQVAGEELLMQSSID